MQIGDCVETVRQFDAAGVAAYHALGGNKTPAGHVPAPLIDAVFSSLMGTKLPGTGTTYLRQDSRFLNHARLDEALRMRVEITQMRPDKPLVTLATTCHGADGRLICSGEALVHVKDVAHAA
ncbi:MAG: hypothetical protein Tsb0016_13810 [Sphingomonadales bacterium]